MTTKQRRARRGVDQPLKMDMSSMIDVSFLLLIFFLVATSLRLIEKDVPMSLAGKPDSTRQVANLDPVELDIRADGSIAIGGEEGMLIEPASESSNLSALRHHLQYFVINAALAEEPMIQLRVDDAVNHQRFTEVMACLTALELSQVSILD